MKQKLNAKYLVIGLLFLIIISGILSIKNG